MSTPDSPQNSPYVVDEPKGARAWCSCGRSQKQPYCDGAHGGTGLRPVVVTLTEPKTVAWCGCKRTKTPPYCDGSHSSPGS